MWLPRSTKAPGALLAALGALLLAACSSGPARAPEHGTGGPGGPGTSVAGSSGTAGSPGSADNAGARGGASVPPPARAVTDFDRAVGQMKAGNAVEAELEFEQIATTYPSLAGPDINLGILYRKHGELDRSEHALREAVERNGGSAVAWNELGVTLRMRGKFRDAEAAYRKAIADDANFAPAYRNLGVLLDLYLGDAPGALDAFERYKTLSGEKEPVSGWIAELRRRAGKGRASAPQPAPAQQSTPAQGSPAQQGGSAQQVREGGRS